MPILMSPQNDKYHDQSFPLFLFFIFWRKCNGVHHRGPAFSFRLFFLCERLGVEVIFIALRDGEMPFFFSFASVHRFEMAVARGVQFGVVDGFAKKLSVQMATF